jgi:phosphoribosylaminoimidazolecarboxamide formyltransferase/IMP cyclohydrolase
VRARNADPKSSFGDFLAFSDRVDLATARLVKREVSDGVIAPDFEPAALELLRSKQDGRFLVLQGDAAYRAPEVEYREVFGVALAQRRNTARISHELFNSLVTRNRALTPDAVRDLLVATITAKFTQSNSVVLALDGQVIGVGAGQQSRIDCVRLAGSKADVWHLRRHPRVRALPLREGLSRAERVNARTLLIQGGMAAPEERGWRAQLAPAAQQQPPAPLSAEEKQSFLATLRGVALSSDAFFPFRDSVDEAAKHGVRFIAQPGRSVEDAAVAQAADEYDMVMALTDLRLFHH